MGHWIDKLLGFNYRIVRTTKLYNDSNLEDEMKIELPFNTLVKLIEIGENIIIDGIPTKWSKIQTEDGIVSWCIYDNLEKVNIKKKSKREILMIVFLNTIPLIIFSSFILYILDAGNYNFTYFIVFTFLFLFVVFIISDRNNRHKIIGSVILMIFIIFIILLTKLNIN